MFDYEPWRARELKVKWDKFNKDKTGKKPAHPTAANAESYAASATGKLFFAHLLSLALQQTNLLPEFYIFKKCGAGFDVIKAV